MIAVLPAAGKGTRMQDVTQGGSKELLSVGDRPVLAWAIEEARECDPTRIVVVSSPDKPDMNAYLAGHGGVDVQMQFVQDGLAPAIALAGTQEAAVVILPDTLFYPKRASARIARALAEGYDIVLLTEEVDSEKVSRYGIVESDESRHILRVLEKPSQYATTSRQAVAGRYGLSARMMAFLSETIMALQDEPGEIGVSPILNLAIRNGLDALALPVLPDETRYDCGSPDGFRLAQEALK